VSGLLLSSLPVSFTDLIFLTVFLHIRVIAMPTSPAFIILLLSTLRAGLVPSLANPAYTTKEFEHILKLVRAKLVLAHSSILTGALKEVGISKDAVVDATWLPSSSSRNGSLWSASEDDLQSAVATVTEAGATQIDWKQTAAIFFR
jgi:acyl-CoA synthetase (AMP-forming)/AMP-acid ligase II